MRRLRHFLSVLQHYICIRWQTLTCSRRVFLLGTPWYGNIGDQAICLGEHVILQEVYQGTKIIDVPYAIFYCRLVRAFGLGIKQKDTIFMQGGGNMGSLYPHEEQIRRDVAKKYADNKIIVMPVSIFFADDEMGQKELIKSIDAYQKARDLTIIQRDEVSHQYALKHFPMVRNILAPDAATSLEGVCRPEVRQGVQFFLRADKEKVSSDTLLDAIKASLQAKNIPYEINDTTINSSVLNEDRRERVQERLQMAAKARVVVTDRFHGLVFSVITHTPVIVFKSFDSKISSGIKWFSDLSWVHYAEGWDQSDILSTIESYTSGKKQAEGCSRCKEKIIEAVKALI